MNRAVSILATGRGVFLAALVGWAALRLGAVHTIDFYPVFIGLALLFVLSLADGIRVQWWGWLLLVPLVPMAINGSYPFELLQFAALWLAIVLGAHQVSRGADAEGRVSLMIYILLGIGILEALLGLAQSLGRFAGQDIPFFPMGTIYNRNHFAGFLEMLVPLSLMVGFAKLYERGRRGGNHIYARRSSASDRAAKAWMFLLAGAILFLAILFSLSRAGAVSAMAGTVIAAFLVSMRQRGTERGFSRLLVAGVIVLVVAGALWIGLQPVIERMVLLPQDAEGRSSVWAGTTRMILDNPWTGVGAGMHGWAYTGYNTLKADIFYDYAHNDYLQAAAEWGVPAALVFFGVVVFMACRAGSACLRAADPVRAGLLAGGVGAVAALLAHSFVDFNLQVPANAILFGLILGTTYGIANTPEVEILKPLAHRND